MECPYPDSKGNFGKGYFPHAALEGCARCMCDVFDGVIRGILSEPDDAYDGKVHEDLEDLVHFRRLAVGTVQLFVRQLRAPGGYSEWDQAMRRGEGTAREDFQVCAALRRMLQLWAKLNTMFPFDDILERYLIMLRRKAPQSNRPYRVRHRSESKKNDNSSPADSSTKPSATSLDVSTDSERCSGTATRFKPRSGGWVWHYRLAGIQFREGCLFKMENLFDAWKQEKSFRLTNIMVTP